MVFQNTAKCGRELSKHIYRRVWPDCACRVGRAPYWFGGTRTRGWLEDHTRQVAPAKKEESGHVLEPVCEKLRLKALWYACPLQEETKPFCSGVHVPEEAPSTRVSSPGPGKLSNSVLKKGVLFSVCHPLSVFASVCVRGLEPKGYLFII